MLLVGLHGCYQRVGVPIRSLALRLAGGHLRERTVVEGEDEMARLAMSV